MLAVYLQLLQCVPTEKGSAVLYSKITLPVESTSFISSFEMIFFSFFLDTSLSSAVFFKCTAHTLLSVVLVPMVERRDFSVCETGWSLWWELRSTFFRRGMVF